MMLAFNRKVVACCLIRFFTKIAEHVDRDILLHHTQFQKMVTIVFHYPSYFMINIHTVYVFENQHWLDITNKLQVNPGVTRPIFEEVGRNRIFSYHIDIFSTIRDINVIYTVFHTSNSYLCNVSNIRYDSIKSLPYCLGFIICYHQGKFNGINFLNNDMFIHQHACMFTWIR